MAQAQPPRARLSVQGSGEAGREQGGREGDGGAGAWRRGVLLQVELAGVVPHVAAAQGLHGPRVVREEAVLGAQPAERLELGVGQPDGVLEVDPGDDLQAGGRGERAVVREVVRAGAGDERGQGELAAQAELGEGRLDLRQVVHHLGVHGVVGRHHLVEKRQHDEPVGLQLGQLGGAVVFLVEHHVQLHRVAVVVDQVLAAEGVVRAPVEVQLGEDVLSLERTA